MAVSTALRDKSERGPPDSPNSALAVWLEVVGNEPMHQAGLSDPFFCAAEDGKENESKGVGGWAGVDERADCNRYRLNTAEAALCTQMYTSVLSSSKVPSLNPG